MNGQLDGQLIPRVHNERCLRFRYRYSECGRCADSCPHQALRPTEEGIALDGGACRHCALCVGQCPTGTFESAAWSPSALVRAATGTKAHTIACSPSGAHGEMVVPCLGALDAATVAFVLSRGTDLALAGIAHCPQCAWQQKAEAALAVLLSGVEQARRSLGGAGWGRLTVADGKGRGIDRAGTERRQWFRRLVAGGTARLTEGEAPSTPVPAQAVRAAPPYRTFSRQLINSLLGDCSLEAHPAFPAGRVVIEGACTGCGLCERVCPTGALLSSEEGGLWELRFRDGQCVGCGVCVEACQSGALGMTSGISNLAREGERLAALPRRRCERCGRLYLPAAGPDASCPVCADDEANFDAIFG